MAKTEEKAVIVDGSEIVSEEVKLDGTELESAKIEPEKVEEQKLTSTTSLLDRLILEAKKNVKETTTIPTETNKANVSELNNSENFLITIPDELESKIGMDIKEYPEYTNIVTKLLKLLIPYDEIVNRIDYIDLDKVIPLEDGEK